MNYLFIHNPNSGSSRSSLKRKRPYLDLIQNQGHKTTLIETQYAGHAYEIAKEYSEKAYDVICAVGGDGTVNEVASALRSTTQVMGILPAGSGNGLARELGIPLDTEEAIETLLRGSTIQIDTCTANGDPFFCTCGMGFDGAVSTEFAKSNMRGPLTYIKDSVHSFFSHSASSYQVSIDGEKQRAYQAFLVACANASQYGNNAFIAPGASLSDGLLDVTIIKDFPIIEATQVAFQLFSKGIGQNAYTELFRGKRVVITTKKPIPYHIDGEPKEPTTRLEINVLPLSLTVVAGKTDEPREKSVLDFFNQITNTYLEWRSELIKEVLDTFKGSGDNI